MSVSKPLVLDELRRIKGPDLEGNIVDLGLVSEILVKDDRVYFSITVPAARAEELEPLRKAAETRCRQGAGRVGGHRRADGGGGARRTCRCIGTSAGEPAVAQARAKAATGNGSHGLRTITVTRMATATRAARGSRSRGPARSRWRRCPGSKP